MSERMNERKKRDKFNDNDERLFNQLDPDFDPQIFRLFQISVSLRFLLCLKTYSQRWKRQLNRACVNAAVCYR